MVSMKNNFAFVFKSVKKYNAYWPIMKLIHARLGKIGFSYHVATRKISSICCT